MLSAWLWVTPACQDPADHIAVAHRLLMPAFGPLPIKSMFPGTCAALDMVNIVLI